MKKLIWLNEFVVMWLLSCYVMWMARGHWGWAAFSLCCTALQCWISARNVPWYVAQKAWEQAEREYLEFMVRLPVHWTWEVTMVQEIQIPIVRRNA